MLRWNVSIRIVHTVNHSSTKGYFNILIWNCFRALSFCWLLIVAFSHYTPMHEVVGQKTWCVFECEIFLPSLLKRFNLLQFLLLVNFGCTNVFRWLDFLGVWTGPFLLPECASFIPMQFQVCWFLDFLGFIHSGDGQILSCYVPLKRMSLVFLFGILVKILVTEPTTCQL